MLIGCNCPKGIKPKEVILGKEEDLYAIRTLLGWRIIGPVGQKDGTCYAIDEGKASTCNCILAHKIGNDKSSHFSFILDSKTKENINPLMVKRMFEQDFSEGFAGLQGLSIIKIGDF